MVKANMEHSGADLVAEGDLCDTDIPEEEESPRVVCPVDLQKILFVQTGFGADQHGQNATKAAVRACRNAIEFNSIPSANALIPGGYKGMKLKVKIGIPKPDTVDLDEVRKVFPYGEPCFEVVEGGLCASSGIALPGMGDTNDDMYIAVAAITVGY